MFEDQEKLHSGEYDEEAMEKAMAKWRYTLGEMIFAMEYIINDDEGGNFKKFGIDTGKTQKCEIDDKDDFRKFLYPDGVEPVYDWSKLDDVEARVQNGLDMFCKYFRNIWD